MQNFEWYLADLKSTGKNTIETVEKSLTDMFIRLVRIYPCLTARKWEGVDVGGSVFLTMPNVLTSELYSSLASPIM